MSVVGDAMWAKVLEVYGSDVVGPDALEGLARLIASCVCLVVKAICASVLFGVLFFIFVRLRMRLV